MSQIRADPDGCRDVNGNPFFLWYTDVGNGAGFMERLLKIGADEVRFRDGTKSVPGHVRLRFTAYRKGECVTQEVFL